MYKISNIVLFQDLSLDIHICIYMCIYTCIYIHTVICLSTLMVHWHPMLVADQLYTYIIHIYVTYTMIIILVHFYSWSKLGSL